LENVRLLATDRNLNDIEGEPKKINTVTIEVTPKQAEMIKVAASMGQLALSLRGLGMPDGKSSGPTVASADATATPASFFAQQAADTPGGPEEGQPKSKSPDTADQDPAPERGQTYTYDTEVSRPMQELMHPTDQKPIQVVRGQPSAAQPTIQNVVPQ
jgi:pilus assembly protein CpaB